MEAKQFAELLKNPLLVEQLPVDALRDLLQRYPFSPSLHMLMLKHHQLNEHPAYDEQLSKAAIYAPDRRALYRLVQLRPVAVEVLPPYETEESTPTTVEQEEPLATVPEEVTDESETPAVPEHEPAYTAWNLPTEQEREEVIEGEAEVEEEAIEPITIIEALPPEVQREVLEPEPETLETAPMLEEIMGSLMEYDLSDRIIPNESTVEEAVEEGHENLPEEAYIEESEIEEGVENDTTEVELVDEEVETPEEPETVFEQAATEQEPIVEEDVTIEETESDEKETVEASKNDNIHPEPEPEANSKDSFIGWLKRINRHEIPLENPQPDTEHDSEEKELDAMFVAGNYEASLLKDASELPLKPFVDPTAKHTKGDLMEPDEEANKRMDEQAKKSMSMGDELVTETLAKIYEIQKKTNKAIEAYEVLKIRHPHKADEYYRKIQKLREI